MGGNKSGSESDSGSEDEKHHKKDKHDRKDKHDKKDKKDKHDKDGKHKDDKHKGDKHESGHHGSGSFGGHMPAALAGIMPGHEKYGGKLKKEDVADLKHRTDISDEEREHRRKVLMAEVAAGVAGAGILSFAGYQAYQHFNKDDENKALEHPKEA